MIVFAQAYAQILATKRRNPYSIARDIALSLVGSQAGGAPGQYSGTAGPIPEIFELVVGTSIRLILQYLL